MRAQWRSRRKPTGGKYRQPYRSKRKFELAGFTTNTTLGETKKKSVRTLGGHKKIKLLLANIANVAHAGKIQQSKILNVIDNPANKFLARRNILTKSAVIVTELGKARVTSRPGQDGVVNAVLIKDK